MFRAALQGSIVLPRNSFLPRKASFFIDILRSSYGSLTPEPPGPGSCARFLLTYLVKFRILCSKINAGVKTASIEVQARHESKAGSLDSVVFHNFSTDVTLKQVWLGNKSGSGEFPYRFFEAVFSFDVRFAVLACA